MQPSHPQTFPNLHVGSASRLCAPSKPGRSRHRAATREWLRSSRLATCPSLPTALPSSCRCLYRRKSAPSRRPRRPYRPPCRWTSHGTGSPGQPPLGGVNDEVRLCNAAHGGELSESGAVDCTLKSSDDLAHVVGPGAESVASAESEDHLLLLYQLGAAFHPTPYLGCLQGRSDHHLRLVAAIVQGKEERPAISRRRGGKVTTTTLPPSLPRSPQKSTLDHPASPPRAMASQASCSERASPKGAPAPHSMASHRIALRPHAQLSALARRQSEGLPSIRRLGMTVVEEQTL